MSPSLEGIDPLEYSIEQLVEALCSPEHGHLRPDGPYGTRKYDCKNLGQVLRENDVDGRAFLCEVDKAFLKDDLEIKSAAKRTGLLHVQQKLRELSEGYKQEARHLTPQANRHGPSMHEDGLDEQILSSIQRLFANNGPLTPFTGGEAHAKAASSANDASIAPPVQHATERDDHPRVDDIPVEPIKKIAPLLITHANDNAQLLPEDPLATKTRKRVAPTPVAVPEVPISNGRYDGPTSPSRKGFVLRSLFEVDAGGDEESAAVSEGDVAEQDYDAEVDMDSILPASDATHSTTCAVNALTKRCWLKGRQAVLNYLQQPSLVLRASGRRTSSGGRANTRCTEKETFPSPADVENDKQLYDEYLNQLLQKYGGSPQEGDENDVLPLYGESDTASIDTEWEAEMEQEEVESRQTKSLSSTRKLELIRAVQDEMREQWRNQKLPVLEAKAYRMWRDVPTKQRKIAKTAELEAWVLRLQQRLARMEADYIKGDYTAELKFRKACENMQITVCDICDSEWTIEMLQRAAAPTKPDVAHLPKKARRATPADLGTDEEDLEFTDWEEDEAGFIVSDEEDIPSGMDMDTGDTFNLPTDNANPNAADTVHDQLSDEPLAATMTQSTVHEAELGAVVDDDLSNPPLFDTHTDEVLSLSTSPTSDKASELQSPRQDENVTEVSIGSPSKPPTGSHGDYSHDNEINIGEGNEHETDDLFVDQPRTPSPDDKEHAEPEDGEVGKNVEDDVRSAGIIEEDGPISHDGELSSQKLHPLVTQRAVWKEPPNVPPRSSSQATRNVVDLLGDASDEPTESEEAEEHVEGTHSDGWKPPLSHLTWQDDALFDESAAMLNETGDRVKMLAWGIQHVPGESRNAAERVTTGKSHIETAFDVKDGLSSLLSHSSRIRKFGLDKQDSSGYMQIASWFAAWIDYRIPTHGKGLRKKQVDDAIADIVEGQMKEYEAFYKAMHDIFLHRRESLTQKEKKAPSSPFSLKRQVIQRSDSEGNSDRPSTRKKRKYRVAESQEAKAVRDNAQRRLVERERQTLRAADRYSKIASNNMALEDTAVNHARNSDEEDVILLNPRIGSKIFPYQVKGIQFMWSEIVQADEMQGCLLAQAMGMGKTLQVIALLVTIAEAGKSENSRVSKQIPPRLARPQFLVLCPATLVNNWYDELLRWVPSPWSDNLGQICKVDSSLSLTERLEEINERWAKTGGILLISYSIFKNLIANKRRKTRGEDEQKEPLNSDQHATICDNLLSLPNLVVCDEAQELKNVKSNVAAAVSRIQTKSRVAMTGSPLSNHLEEYYHLIDFIAPTYLGALDEFKYKFVEPITDGMYMDATPYEKRKGLKMLSVLKSEIAPKMHRDDLSVLRSQLPGKTEFVIRTPLTKLQEKCYKLFVSSVLDNAPEDAAFARVWAYVAYLKYLCNHPYCFERKLADRESLSEVQSSAKGTTTTQSVEEEADRLAEEPDKLLQQSMMQKQLQILQEATPAKDLVRPEHSHKMELLCEILEKASEARERTLVFSHNLSTLNFIQDRILKIKYPDRWTRLDGKTNVNSRQDMTKRFNEGKFDISLISTRAGGTGLNLYGASRVVIMDEHYNPMYEQQAIGRAYRIGQTKHVYVYRLIVGGTYEEAMQNQALFKVGLSNRVVDMKNTIRQARKGLKEWIYQPKEVPQDTFDQFLGKDTQVLDSILSKHKDDGIIRTILLAETFMDEEDEELTPEEQKEAQEETELLQLQRKDPHRYAIKKREMEERAQRTAFSNLENPAPFGPVSNFTPASSMPPTRSSLDTTVPVPPIWSSTQPHASVSSHTLYPVKPPTTSDPSLGPQHSRSQIRQSSESERTLQEPQALPARPKSASPVTPAQSTAVVAPATPPEAAPPTGSTSSRSIGIKSEKETPLVKQFPSSVDVIQISSDEEMSSTIATTTRPAQAVKATSSDRNGNVKPKPAAETGRRSPSIEKIYRTTSEVAKGPSKPLPLEAETSPVTSDASKGATKTAASDHRSLEASRVPHRPVLGDGVQVSRPTSSNSVGQAATSSMEHNTKSIAIRTSLRQSARKKLRARFREKWPELVEEGLLREIPSKTLTKALASRTERVAYEKADSEAAYLNAMETATTKWVRDNNRLANQARKLSRQGSRVSSSPLEVDQPNATPKSVWSARSATLDTSPDLDEKSTRPKLPSKKRSQAGRETRASRDREGHGDEQQEGERKQFKVDDCNPQ